MKEILWLLSMSQKLSDGLEEELRMLCGYGAGAKAIIWLGGGAKEVISSYMATEQELR
jgi:hypothetical protein